MNTNFKVISLTRLGIKPESVAPEADAFTTRPSELRFHLDVIKGIDVVANYEKTTIKYFNKVMQQQNNSRSRIIYFVFF